MRGSLFHSSVHRPHSAWPSLPHVSRARAHSRRHPLSHPPAATYQELIQSLAPDLPIQEVIPQILSSLDKNNCLILQAPPGAGKTTLCPLALLLSQPSFLDGSSGKILVLEPRRVAAKGAAKRMAAMLNEPPGRRVGYRVKLETKVSSATRIEVITEGILLRMLQEDPGLEGVGCILFDEFHERGINADLALALTLDSQAALRNDLRIMVMSATLGGGLAERLSVLMSSNTLSGEEEGGRVSIITSEGRAYPVDIHHVGQWTREEGMEGGVADAVLAALRKHPEGDILAFLPGVGEIKGTERRLMQMLSSSSRIKILQLHGSLPPQQQDYVISRRGPAGERRVILSTPIAESSVTVEGVRIVVDAGFRRSPVFDSVSLIDRLKLRRISLSSADQRAGRAGRQGPGHCYRLWDKGGVDMEESTPPEIVDADLTPLALELGLWGDVEGTSLRWLDRPPAERMGDARELLMEMGAIDNKGRPTERGKRMGRMGTHPRFANLILIGSAPDIGAAELSCLIAAMLSEKDILLSQGPSTADATQRIQALIQLLTFIDSPGHLASVMDVATGKRVVDTALAFLSQLNRKGSDEAKADTDDDEELDEGNDEEDDRKVVKPTPLSSASLRQALEAQVGKSGLLGALIALCCPDRIARRKDKTSFIMADGRTVNLRSSDALSVTTSPYLSIAELSGKGGDEYSGRNDQIRIAAPLSNEAIERWLQPLVATRRVAIWASASKAVIGKEQRRLGALVLSEKSVPVQDEEAKAPLLRGFKEMNGLASFALSKELEAWRSRVLWLKTNDKSAGTSSLPDLSNEGLVASSPSWLFTYASQCRSKQDLTSLDWKMILEEMVGGHQAAMKLNDKVPTHFETPTGTRVLIDYSRSNPTASVRIQEVFGLSSSPLVGEGIPVVLELLSPGQKPIQTTADLAGFWKSSYQLVKSDMKGRYPRHIWPDDPATAEATKMSKKRFEQAKEEEEALAAAAAATQKQSKGAGGSSQKKKGKR